ncbi:MAG: response regulator transcription factor, partial [Bacteroidetes bacterium]|nr:response regulator transcription factor [Bacteroidota bacterium]
EGLSNTEVAAKLFVSLRTVETHKSNILQKLQLKNTVELVKFALKHNLLEI